MTRAMAVSMAVLVMLSGCAAFDEPARFAPGEYSGVTPLERLLDMVNLEKNRARPCGMNERCQSGLPSRTEVATANFYDCKAYVMSKAYALQDAGIEASRMRVASLGLMGLRHAVLVVDNRYVLDNLDGSVRQLQEYTRFEPMLSDLPARLMVRDSAVSAN